MPSFDIVIELDKQEVDNAVNQATKEMTQRYDFRGTKSKIEWDKDKTISLTGDDDFKLKAVWDILQSKMIKRGISVKNIEMGKVESGTEGLARQKLTLQSGIPSDKAKQITKIIKEQKMKVQPAVQDEQVRVTAKKIDDLQAVISVIKQSDLGMDFQFINFRD